jgi:hypothetical protein
MDTGVSAYVPPRFETVKLSEAERATYRKRLTAPHIAQQVPVIRVKCRVKCRVKYWVKCRVRQRVKHRRFRGFFSRG